MSHHDPNDPEHYDRMRSKLEGLILKRGCIITGPCNSCDREVTGTLGLRMAYSEGDVWIETWIIELKPSASGLSEIGPEHLKQAHALARVKLNDVPGMHCLGSMDQVLGGANVDN